MRSSSAKRVLVTGAANGIGAEAAMQLAQLGLHVIVADKDIHRGEQVAQTITADGGSAEFRVLELADLKAIRTFADDELAQDQPLDIVINNAGILPPKERATTRDGFELEFGIAYLGHFALTGHLLPALKRSQSPRVISVSSLSHMYGGVDFDNLQFDRNYRSSMAYTSTKFACLMFAIELDRLTRAFESPLISVAAHPGISNTSIASGWKSEGRQKISDRFELWSYQVLAKLFGQSAKDSARPLVYAATSADIEAGKYYGPTGLFEMNGEPGLATPCRCVWNSSIAKRLWQVSEQLTGVRYQL